MKYKINSLLLEGFSCFTSCLFTYAQAKNLPALELFGGQMHFRLHHQDSKPLVNRLRFSNYYESLRNFGKSFILPLTRVCTDFYKTFEVALTRELKREGIVIVCGDIYNLPWSVNFKKKHAPHWFIVTKINTERFQVIDNFAYTDINGRQDVYIGFLPTSQLKQIVVSTPTLPSYLENREALVFGDCLTPEHKNSALYQWYELATDRCCEVDWTNALVHYLENNTLWCTGDMVCPEPTLPTGWLIGDAAYAFLAQVLETNLTHDSLYQYIDDFWVTSRARYLHFLYLKAQQDALEALGLHTFAEDFHTSIVMTWANFVQLMHFNQDCLKKGLKVRSLPIKLLNEISLQERRYADLVMAVLS